MKPVYKYFKKFLRFLKLTSDYLIIKKSGLFDERYYLLENSDVRKNDVNPLFHFVRYGAKEFRNPSEKFNTKIYFDNFPDIKNLNLNPLVDFINLSQSQKQKISILMKSIPQKAKQIPQSEIEIKCERIVHRQRNSWDFEQEKIFKNKIKKFILNNKNKKNAKPFVSVIMPTYNRAKSISSAINSALNQTYKNFELIIIDDGSKDNTDKIVSNFKDKRISYIKRSNKGASIARNEGLKIATGDFIFFLDSDNQWKDDFLEIMIGFLISNQLDAAYSGIAISRDFKNICAYLGDEFDYASLMNLNFIDLNSFCLKNDSDMQYFDIKLKRLIDWDFILANTYRKRVGYAPFIGVDYYDGDDGNRITKTISLSNGKKNLIKHIQDKHRLNIANYPNESLKKISKNLNNKIAILVHIYYLDQIPELIERLKKIEYLFDLLITTPHPKNKIENMFNQSTFFIKIYEFNNVGRDIGPMLYLIPTLMSYKAVLKIHTKRDIPSHGSELWRNILWDNLLNNNNYFYDKKNFNKFINNDFETAIGLDKTYINDSDLYPSIAFKVHKMVEMYYNQKLPKDWGFFAGSMFWFQPHIYKEIQLLFENIKFKNHKKVNYEIEHTVERLLGAIFSIKLNKLVLNQINNTKTSTNKKNYVLRSANLGENIRVLYDFLQNKKAKKSIALKKNDIFFAIKIAVPNHEIKSTWGDWHFAKSLQSAFLKQGYESRIDILPDWYTNNNNDEINIIIRGLQEFKVTRKNLNLLWLVSHSDKVSLKELSQYNHVFVASERYANTIRSQGIDTSTMLQCTDIDKFNLGAKKINVSDVIFVGNSRGQKRQIVEDAISEKIPFNVYGGNWENIVDMKYVANDFINNDDLPSYYKSAKVVLCDHWEDMKREGFVSNRIYDVLASGGQVISDHVITGQDYFFNGYVSIYKNAADLKKIIHATINSKVNRKKRLEIFEDIKAHYSFDERVNQFIRKVTELL